MYYTVYILSYIYIYVTQSSVCDSSKHRNRPENLVILGRSRRSQANKKTWEHFNSIPSKTDSLPQDISEKGDLLKKCFAGAAGINATHQVEESTQRWFVLLPLPHRFAGARSTTHSFSFKGNFPLQQNSKFFGRSCVRSMCNVLNFYAFDTKRKRRVGFTMPFRKSAWFFSQDFVDQRPQGRILQFFLLQNPSVALPQYHLLGDQKTAAFDCKAQNLSISGCVLKTTPSFRGYSFVYLEKPNAEIGGCRFLSPTRSIDLLHIYL